MMRLLLLTALGLVLTAWTHGTPLQGGDLLTKANGNLLTKANGNLLTR